MSRILIVSDQQELTDNIGNLLLNVGYKSEIAVNEITAFKLTTEFSPDIALVDTACSSININTICKKLKLQGQNNDIQIILLASKDTSSEEVMVGADGYITKPFNDNILIATINAHLRIKKLLDILYTNNSELARSLYQLNVLYNTSSQLAGTLEKSKLISIMNEGLEKSISYSLCSTLFINDSENVKLIIKSLHPITDRLEQALMLRAILGYKNLFEDKKPPFELSISNVKVEKYSKHETGSFDLEILRYDNLFSPISTSDKFFGTVEILREIDLSGEDSTCFQTVVKQVSLPLESAILYEEIKETNMKLEKLEKLKSEFISIVSHELRTPLTAIKNSLDIMLSGKTGETTKTMNNFLNMAKRNVTRLSGIINDLLDLSKIEAGKMDYRFEQLNLIEPIEFIKNTFEHLAQQKNITLSIDIKPNLPCIYGDIQRIEQVMSNLVSNAIKFTPENGHIKLKAKIINIKDLDPLKFFTSPDSLNKKYLTKTYVQISVEDSGIGIKEEDIPKVFDKFQQIESSLSREVGGTGLGLPIAKQLIEAHRGDIWLESEFEKGSKFSFILPVMDNYSVFLLELDNELQQAKHNHSSFALISIQEEFDHKNNSIINDIINYKVSITRKQDKFKFFTQKDKNLIKLQIILTNSDNETSDFIKKRFENLLKNNEYNYNSAKILLGLSIYPDQAITSEELIEHSKKFLRPVMLDR